MCASYRYVLKTLSIKGLLTFFQEEHIAKRIQPKIDICGVCLEVIQH